MCSSSCSFVPSEWSSALVTGRTCRRSSHGAICARAHLRSRGATMDLNGLTLFEAVARTSSFSAAAKELGLPKSTVSRGVARLEAEVGTQLLFRTTRQVALSEAGTALYDRIAPLLRSVKSAIGELPEREEQPSGTLRVTAPVDLGVFILADVVTRYAARYPQ